MAGSKKGIPKEKEKLYNWTYNFFFLHGNGFVNEMHIYMSWVVSFPININYEKSHKHVKM